MQYDYTPSIIVFLGLFTIMAASLLIILYWWRKDSSEYNKRARRAEHDQFSSTSVTISGHDQLRDSQRRSEMQKAVYKNKDCQIHVCFHGDIANSVKIRRGKIHLNLKNLPLYWMETFKHKGQMYAVVKIKDKYAQLFNVSRMHGKKAMKGIEAQTIRIK